MLWFDCISVFLSRCFFLGVLMEVLLTGSAGFIGYHLAKHLIGLGHTVTSIDNINPYYSVDLKYARLQSLGFDRIAIDDGALVASSTSPDHQFIKMDLCDRELTREFFLGKRFDCICHLAAQPGVRYSIENPMSYIDHNINAFANVLEGARHQKIGHFVFASSSSVYGLNAAHPYQTSHSTSHPASLYAATKKSNEMMAHAYSHLYGIPTTGLRFFTVYGPWGRPDMAPMLFLDAIVNDRPIKVFNQGEMFRDFTYIDTIVDGCARVISKPTSSDVGWRADDERVNRSSAPFAIYNIGGESTVKLTDFISTLESVLGRKAHCVFTDMPPGDVLHTEACMDDFVEQFGRLECIDLKIGLQNLFSWYRSNLSLFDLTHQRVH